jgi:hypothetical protein
MMQYMTNDFLPSTPHKVGLNTRERYTFAYFHEPNFSSVIQPLPEYGGVNKDIHYGTHFTNMFMRNYPKRVTARRMRAENRMAILDSPLVRRSNAMRTAGEHVTSQPRALGQARIWAEERHTKGVVPGRTGGPTPFLGLSEVFHP